MIDDTTDDDALLGVISASGPDAAEFLRAQLTNDVLRLGSDRHFLAGWCDAKGRVLMLARVAWVSDRFLLLVPRTLIPALIQRLRMYVLRAKVTIADESNAFVLSGLIGGDLPGVNCTMTDGHTTRLGLPATADGQPRALVLSPDETSRPTEALPLDSNAWQLGEIDAGVPEVNAAVQNAYVPQMLNLHWLMAVDFDKGCYPGQEIVARLHYRGRLTQRVFRFQWQGQAPAIGAAVQIGDGQDVGRVLQRARTDAEEGRLLAVVKVEAAADTTLRCGDARLSQLDLPYATPD